MSIKRTLMLGLASHAIGRLWHGDQPLLGDLLAAVRAETIGAIVKTSLRVHQMGQLSVPAATTFR
nr:hypothetical protein [Hydrogenophaga sp. BPS33]